MVNEQVNKISAMIGDLWIEAKELVIVSRVPCSTDFECMRDGRVRTCPLVTLTEYHITLGSRRRRKRRRRKRRRRKRRRRKKRRRKRILFIQ